MAVSNFGLQMNGIITKQTNKEPVKDQEPTQSGVIPDVE